MVVINWVEISILKFEAPLYKHNFLSKNYVNIMNYLLRLIKFSLKLSVWKINVFYIYIINRYYISIHNIIYIKKNPWSPFLLTVIIIFVDRDHFVHIWHRGTHVWLCCDMSVFLQLKKGRFNTPGSGKFSFFKQNSGRLNCSPPGCRQAWPKERRQRNQICM